SQVQMDVVVTRGIVLARGFLARQADRLVKAVLDGIQEHLDSRLTVSRPLPEPAADGVYVAHLEFRGVWLRLVVGHEERGSVAAVLSALIGKAPTPLAEPDASIEWLET